MQPSIPSAICALAVLALRGQVNDSAPVVNGSVLDSNGKPVAAVVVELRSRDRTITSTTNSEGIYRFSATPEISYTLRARLGPTAEATFGPFVLTQNETKTVALTP